VSELLDRPLRTAILAAADNPIVRRGVTRYGMRLGARRFVAGESIADFLPVAREANRRGFSVAATLLGESIRDAAQARGVTDEYCRLLQAFAQEELDANVAFKLTHVGLDISPELALENASRIAAQAQATDNTVRLDMEQSSYVDATLRNFVAFSRSATAAPASFLQSYLYRSESDLRAMLPSAPNVRIVKGAYLEPPSLAFAHKRDVDENYVKLAELALSHDGYTAIATHDAAIVARIEEFAAVRACPNAAASSFKPSTASPSRSLAAWSSVDIACDSRCRTARFWFPYLMRRLAERPANVGFFLKNAFAPR